MAVGERYVVAPDAPHTMPEWIRHKAARNGDKEAIEVEGSSRTYAQIDHETDRVGAGFASFGFEPGDHCALMMTNSIENIDTWFGMSKAGVVELAVHNAARGNLLRHVVDHGVAKGMVLDEEYLPYLASVAADLPRLEHVFVHRTSDGALDRGDLPRRIALHDRRELVVDAAPPKLSTTLDMPTSILHSSGTTGPPKGVIISHHSAIHTARHLAWLMDYTAQDRLYSAFPLFHNNAKYTTVMAAMAADGFCTLDSRFTVSGFWDIIRQERITAFNYMGALLMMLFKQDPRPDDADNEVRIAFGAPCPVEIWEPFEERFGMKLVEVFGRTEAPMACENRLDDRKIGSAGKESMSYEVRIVDEWDRPVPPGTPGEIVLRPKGPYYLFSGYHRLPEKTVEAWRNLWFHSGDRGRMDEDGFVYFIDRLKDNIRRRGENISSWEVESVVNTHEEVLEAAAYGVASELTEQEVMIAVALTPGSNLRPEEILDFCQGKMSHFAVPRYVRFMEALPRNHAERVEKVKLRSEGITDDTWDREDVGYVVRR